MRAIKFFAALFVLSWLTVPTFVAAADAPPAPPEYSCSPAPFGTGSPWYTKVSLHSFSVVWWCPAADGKTWLRQGFWGNWDEVPPNWQEIASDLMQGTEAARKAAWISGLSQPSDPDETEALALYTANVAAHQAPYAGARQLHVVKTTVFKMRQAQDLYSMLPYATVPLNTPCLEASPLAGLYAVPQNLVKLNSWLDTKPLISWAECSW